MTCYKVKRTRMMLTAFSVVAALIIHMASAFAEAPIVGLLTLPELFGHGPCEQFSPKVIPLYSVSESEQAVGVIRVDQFWRFAAVGGCEGLIVNVHNKADGSVSLLDTQEFDYESPAAVVLEQHNDWFKLRTADGPVWIQATPQAKYHSLASLLQKRLSYITPASAGHIFTRPGGSDISASVSGETSVSVVKSTNVDDKLWLYVQVMSHSICDPSEKPDVVLQGWMPAYTPAGQLNLWFYARGC